MTDSREVATWLGGLGFSVFPIAAGAKFPPLWKSWPERASTTVPADWPEQANIGIHCEGLLVLDVDVRSGGLESFAALDMLEGFPETLVTETPTGGRHYFYRLPAGHPGVGNSAGKLMPGLDVKTTGGYVVAPGSTVAAGVYKFATDSTVSDAPAWLVNRLGVRTEREPTVPAATISDAGAHALTVAREWLSTQPTGEGAYATACGLRDRGLSLAQAQELMLEHDPRGNVPGKVEHAYAYATGTPGAKVAAPEDFPELPLPPRPAIPGLTRLADLAGGRLDGPDYLIKGVLSKGTHGVLYGPPGAGKTFVTLDMAYHIAAGLEWRGKRVRQAPVLYLAYEGIGGMKARAKALTQHYGNADVPLYVVPANFDLTAKEYREALGEMTGLMPEKPGLIVIDTLARAMPGKDENSAQDMGALNAAASALIAATGACVLFIHHTGKAGGSARGSSALLGAIDTELCVQDNSLFATKQRDVELGEPVYFRLKPVMVGIDADGDEITSCVVAEAPKPAAAHDLKGNTLYGFEVLCRLAPNNHVVTEREWLDACTEFLGVQPGKKFYEVKRALVKRKLIEKADDGWRRKLVEPQSD